MVIYDATQTTTTTLDSDISDYSVDSKALDYAGAEEETTWTFSEATQNIGYYTSIPELKRAIDSLAVWVAGRGFETDKSTEIILENITGWGEDTFTSILQSLLIMKKVVGDAFAEIIRNDETGDLLNLKPISPERMKIIVNRQGIIIRYEHQKINGEWEKFEPTEILHLCNNRIADQIHGTSTIDACKWVIDARNEALEDERKIKHRELALGVLYVDTDDTTKRDEIIKQYGNAVKNGEVLVLPKEVAELKDPGVKPQEKLNWIQYLENFFYQAVGIPRVIATSQDYTEAASKVGYLTFEPIYVNEQTLLEEDLWNQLAIKIKFNRPASLGGTLQQDEAKNTGQLGFQPTETQATITRTE